MGVAVPDDDDEGASMALCRLVAFLRVLRGARLLLRIQPVKDMVQSLIAVISIVTPVLLMFSVVFYAYATIGVELYGGMLPSASGNDRLDDREFRSLNFNSFFSALLTLFMLVVNGWNDTLEVLVRQTSLWSVLYFATFWLFADTLLLNLFVALMLDVYDRVKERERHRLRG
eukprot:Selendium_serpulae@DN6156_c0_g1_i1.p2